MKNIYVGAAVGVMSLALITGCSSIGASSSESDGSDYPTDDPVTIITPYSAGGASDTYIRALEPFLADELGTDVIIENMVGAGGQIGITEMTNSDADGYTIALTNLPSTLAYLNPDKQAPYDASDFEPLGSINRFQWVLAAQDDADWEDLDDFIAEAEANPGSIAVGTDGLTGDDHMALIQFQELTGTDLKVVPFDSGSEKMTALLGGQIDASFGSFPTFSAQLETGELKALAALEEEPISEFEDVQTAKEQGVDLEWSSYSVLSAPAGIPEEVSTKLEDSIEAAVETALEDPDFNETMTNSGFVIEHLNADATRETWDGLEATFEELMPQARSE